MFEQNKETIPKAGNIASYIQRNSQYPIYQNTDIVYFDEAVTGLEAQLKDLKKAQKFIFMEYHAIEDAEAWHKIQDVLEERVKAGVEVRVFYDDMGSIGFINTDFVKKDGGNRNSLPCIQSVCARFKSVFEQS